MNEITITDKKDGGRYISAMRSDGLTVFFDKGGDPVENYLNKIRETGTRQEVFAAVGAVRGLQIARSYAQRYGLLEDVDAVNQAINNLISGGKKCIER